MSKRDVSARKAGYPPGLGATLSRTDRKCRKEQKAGITVMCRTDRKGRLPAGLAHGLDITDRNVQKRD